MAVAGARLEPLDDAHVPQAFLGLFADNVEVFGGVVGPDAVAQYLQSERARLKSEVREIRIGESDQPIGLAAWLAPHPREPHPWIGILALDAAHRGRGIGPLIARQIEAQLAAGGWREVRLGVLLSNPRALAFWQRQGYLAYDERPAEDGRMCSCLRKVLTGR